MVVKLAAYCHLVLRLRMTAAILLIFLRGIDMDNSLYMTLQILNCAARIT